MLILLSIVAWNGNGESQAYLGLAILGLNLEESHAPIAVPGFVADSVCLAAVALSRSSAQPSSATTPNETLLTGSSRQPPVSGWTMVHLSGSPAQIGYQHGYL